MVMRQPLQCQMDAGQRNSQRKRKLHCNDRSASRKPKRAHGCSRRQVQAMLTHSRTLGHRGQRLPPGHDTLWKTVNEVTLLYKQHTGAIVVPYLHLNAQHCHILDHFDHPPCIPDPPQCHSRFMRPCDLVECVVAAPAEVQELMSVPADKITF